MEREAGKKKRKNSKNSILALTFLPTNKLVHQNFIDKSVHPTHESQQCTRKVLANKFIHKCHAPHLVCFDEYI